MKKNYLVKFATILAGIFALIFTGSLSAQNYNMSGAGNINTCGGTYLDPGGNSDYGNSQSFTQTICSNNGQPIYLQFTSFQLESGFDNLVIYNGPNTSSPLIGSYTGTTSPGSVQGSGTCITLVFTSDGSVVYSGWTATIGCGTVPPPPPPPYVQDCNVGDPFCTGTTYNFPNNTNVPSYGGGGVFGCLGSTPNPVWYYLQIANGGNINIGISQTSTAGVGIDVDFVLWGPFTSLANGCPALSSTNIESCSYSGSATETATITGAVAGEFYILLLTNFSNTAGNITFSQASGNGSTNCNILCSITAMTGTPGACNPATNTFNATGNIQTYAPPTSGTLNISSSCGGSTTINPPFGTSINYTVTNIPAGSGTCTLTAVYSADPTCTYTVAITAPPPCTSCTATATNGGPYCPGQTIQLNATGGGTYSWSGPGGFTSNQQNPTRTGATTAMSGTYTVTVVNGTATCTATTSVTVNPSPTPTATNGGPYCPGQTISLTGTGGGTYSWSGPGAYTSTLASPTRPAATTAMSGVYTVTVTVNGCTATATTSVTVNPTPTPTASNAGPYCPGQTIALTGTGGGTYSWSGPGAYTSTLASPTRPGATTAMSGVYTVTVTVNGCTATATTSVTVNPAPTPTASNTGPYCPGATISLTGTGGGTYSWSGPGAYTSTLASPTRPGATTAMGGVYTVTVTVNGCTATTTTSVTVNPTPTPTASNTGPYCPGAAIALTATGGGTYSWSGPGGFTSTSATPTIAGATTAMSGVYTVTVTVNGCTATATTSVTVNPTPTPTASNTGPYCPGATISLTGTGGGTYSWSGPGAYTSTLASPTRPGATTAMGGVYTVTVTVNGCTATATTSVTVNPSPTPTASNTGPYCPGATIALTATGGGTYSWSGPGGFTSTSATPTIAAATTAMSGVYTVTVTVNGCTATTTTSVTVNPTPTPTASNTGPYCPGAAIALTATGGGTYSWSGPGGFTSTSATPTIAGATTAMSGVYTVTVTVNGCTATTTTSVTVNPTPTPTASNSGPYCPGSSVQLSATGGGTYSWSGPNAFTSALQNPTVGAATTAMQGVYTVTVTLNSCTATATTSVTVNSALIPGISSNSPICEGTTLNLSCTNGVTWSWTGPNGFTSSLQNPSIASATPAASGTYSATVTDASGCTGTATLSVTVNPLPLPTATNTGPYCEGSTISLTATAGGSYSWSGPNGFTSTSAAPTIASSTTAMSGAYTVTVTLNGCTATATTSVTVNPLPVPTATNTGPYCAGATIALTATGGGTYSWSGPNGFTSSSATPTIAASTTAMSGVYTVTVTLTGCTATATTSVTVNPLPVPTASNTGAYCEGATIALSSTGGGTYSWSGPNGFTDATQNPTIATSTPAMSGVYTVTVTLGSCTATATTSVTVNPLPLATATNTGPYCPGVATQLNAGGGGTYSWAGPNGFTSTSQNPSLGTAAAGLAGVYSVTVTLNSCTATASTTVSVNAALVPGLSTNSPICDGGQLDLICANGITWSWTGPNGFTSSQQNPSITGVTTAASGTYSVSVTDAAGCSGTGTVAVTVNPLPTPTASNAGPFCEGTAISLSSTGGGTYAWSGPNGYASTVQNPAIANATTAIGGAYTVTVTLNGCTATATTTVTVNPLPVPTAANTGAYCEGAAINLSATGGGTYSWSGPNAFTSAIQNPTIAASTTAMGGVYTVTVTLTGCTATATTSVTVNPLPVPTAANSGPYCEGASISLSSTGGGTYAWSGPNAYSDAVQNPSIAASTTAMSGVYTVTVTALGCTATASTTVTVNPIPVPTAGNSGPYCLNTPVQLNAGGGTGYSWSGPNAFTDATQNPTVGPATTAMAGVYTVTVTALGCTATATTTVVVNTALVPGISSNSPVCDGTVLNLTCSNGVSWTWTGPNAFSSSVQNPTINPVTTAATGTYSISVTDANGCVGTGTISVVVNPLPIVTVNSTAICLGQATATLTANGASTYSWSAGTSPSTGASVIATPSSTTSYTVTGTDGNGCVDTSVATVTVNPLPVITVTNTGPYCVNATIQLNATGGTSYAWTGPNTFSNATQNPTITPATTVEAGQYDVTVTDANGCVSAGSTTVVVNTALTPALSTNSPVCEGTSLDLFCTNGVTWSWTGPNGFTSTQQNPSVNPASPAATGTYSISLTDANGCVGTGTISAVVNALPVVSVNSPAICLGQATASMTANGAVNYAWSPGTSPSTGANVIATPGSTTSYTVTGTDANGCMDTSVAVVTVYPLPIITVSNTGPYCVNATIQLDATGGTTYAWTGPSGFTSSLATATITSSTTANAGQYDVTVTDANGCTASGSTIVVVNTALVPSLSTNSPVCEHDSLGLFCSNGVSWSWTGPNGFTSVLQNPGINPASPAATGTYSVSLTDANGCVGTGTISATVNPLPVVTVNSAAICSTQATAGLTAAGALNYVWSAGTNPSTGASVSADPTSTTSYTVTGTDANGCVDTSVALVTVYPLPIVTVNSTAICPGFSANLTASGASTYTWSVGTTPSTGANVSVSPASTTSYTVTGTDANGCTDTSVSTVTVNAQLTVSAGVDDTICFGDNIVLNATGGPAGTTFTWTPGPLSGATQTISASATTTFTLNAVDPNGCAGSDSVIITVPPQITLNAAGFATSCNGMCDGQVVVIPSPSSGAFANYTYLWQSGGATTPSVLSVCAGTYTVTVTDGAGCSDTISATVTQPTAITDAVSAVTPASCNGICDGSATVTLTGGTTPYTYTWSNGNTINNPADLCAGVNTCDWQDANGCAGTSTVTITEPALITASINPVSTICIGQSATLTAVAGGGNSGYTYSWSAGTTPNNTASVTASPTVTTSYSVTISDANNCAPATASVIVVVNPPLSVVASNNVSICFGQTANMSATGNGGNGSYTYSWASGTTPGSGANVSSTPTVTTTYTVTVTDGCGTPSALDTITVVVNPLPSLTITASQPDGCAPVCATFTANNPTPLTSVNWTFTNGQTTSGSTTPSICFDEAGVIGANIIATDVNGCQNTFTNNTLVTVFPVPNAEFDFGPQPATEANPLITFTDLSSGATIDSWFWSFGNPEDSTSTAQNPFFDFQVAGNYDVWLTVTSDHGCVDSVVHTIVIDPEFILYVPNAFSPNDDGNNDTFFPKGLGVDTDDYQMWIYDRWGNMIFTTDEWHKAWDGKVQGHDQVVMQDVYVWKIKLKTWNGEKRSYVGHVTVVK